MRAGEAVKFGPLAGSASDATYTDQFVLEGGRYQVLAVGTGSGVTANLYQLASDLVTWVLVNSGTPVSVPTIFELPPGIYRFELEIGFTDAYVAIVRIPTGE